MLLWGCTEGNSCSLARGCGFPGGSVAQGREEQQDGTERGVGESFEPAATWPGTACRGGQGALRGAVPVLDVFCVPAHTVLCSAQTFQQGKQRGDHLGLGAAQLIVVPGSPRCPLPFAAPGEIPLPWAPCNVACPTGSSLPLLQWLCWGRSCSQGLTSQPSDAPQPGQHPQAAGGMIPVGCCRRDSGPSPSIPVIHSRVPLSPLISKWKFPLGLPLFGPSSPLAPARQPSVQQVKLCRCSRLPTAAP